MAYNKDRDSIFNIYNRIIEEQNQQELEGTMDPKYFKEFETKLVRAKFNLYKKHPFFGLTLQKMKTVPVTPEEVKRYGIDTMAVDNFRNIFINTDFVLKQLSDEEVMGVLAHEVMHIATQSFTRQRGRDATIWNYATDYIMNRDLLIEGIVLPKLGLIPQNVGGRWIVEIPDASKAKVKVTGKINPNNPTKNVQVTGINMKKVDVTEMTAEQLYDILLKNNPPSECIQKIKQILDEIGEMDKHLSPQESQQIQGQTTPNGDPVYSKNSGEGKSEEQANSENRSIVQQAAQEAQQEAKKRGKASGLPRSFDMSSLNAKVNWKSLLKGFIIGTTIVKTDPVRQDKRFGNDAYFKPRTYTEKNQIQAVVAIDTSGSITDPVLKTFLGEILNIININRGKDIKMTVLLWDTEVADVFDIDTKKMPPSKIREGLMNMKATGGGTELSCVAEFLEKRNPGKPIKGGLLVFTDGRVENNPILPKAPKKLFLITKDGTDEILKKYGPTHFIDVEYS